MPDCQTCPDFFDCPLFRTGSASRLAPGIKVIPPLPGPIDESIIEALASDGKGTFILIGTVPL
jgi:hypothetical protein